MLTQSKEGLQAKINISWHGVGVVYALTQVPVMTLKVVYMLLIPLLNRYNKFRMKFADQVETRGPEGASAASAHLQDWTWEGRSLLGVSNVSDALSALVQHDSLWLERHNVSKCRAHIIRYRRFGISCTCHAVCCYKTIGPATASDTLSAVCHQQQHFTIPLCKQEQLSSTP